MVEQLRQVSRRKVPNIIVRNGSTWRNFTVSAVWEFLAIIMLCYGISFAINYSILLKFDKAAICCLLTVIGGFIVARWYKKEVKVLAQTGTFSDNSKQQTQQQD